MNLKKIEANNNLPYTALLYCRPGVGKSTAIGLIAERSEGNTLVLDVDRTVMTTLAKGEIVKDTSKILVQQIENRGKDVDHNVPGTFADWVNTIKSLTPEFIAENDIKTIAVDNISELERCILSDLGSQGKNKGVPAMADYQYMQFALVNSLRHMKSLNVNVLWTAWESAEAFTHTDGSQYTRLYPKISVKILDNICGLCDIVGRIGINKDGEHFVMLKPTQNIHAKNQLDTRDICRVEDFVPMGRKETVE